MCDYSLLFVTSRPARLGEKLVTTRFPQSISRGFAAIGEPEVAVCLRAGTELAFMEGVQYGYAFKVFGEARADYRVARFCQVNIDDPHMHHDALAFPNGKVVLVARLVAGQTATVLQLPVSQREDRSAVNESERERIQLR
jgi:hypothetical protein